MEWAVETVLPREVRKLTSAIEEKDAALAFDLQGRDNQIQAIQYENVALQAHKEDVYQAQLQRCKRHHHPSYLMIMREIPVKTKLSSLYGNTQRLPKISFMICHIMSRGHNDIKGMLNEDGLINIFLSMKLLWRRQSK